MAESRDKCQGNGFSVVLAVGVRTLDTDCLVPTGRNADLLSLRFFQKAGEPFVGEMFINILLKENRNCLSSSRIMSQALSKKKTLVT